MVTLWIGVLGYCCRLDLYLWSGHWGWIPVDWIEFLIRCSVSVEGFGDQDVQKEGNIFGRGMGDHTGRNFKNEKNSGGVARKIFYFWRTHFALHVLGLAIIVIIFSPYSFLYVWRCLLFQCRTIYDLCTQKPPRNYSQQLYDRYIEAFDEYFSTTVSCVLLLQLHASWVQVLVDNDEQSFVKIF